jgi:glycosyltransferase involved in cell wall biosynthesis
MPKYSNLKVFMNETNVGTYITRNTLYQYAKGSHIVQFDSDDIMIKTLLTELDPLANKFDVVKFMGQNFRGKENVGRPKEMCSPGIYKRWIYDTFGGYDSWKIVADSEFNARIKPFTKKIMKLKVVMKRRLHDSSLMALHPPSEQYRTEEKNRIKKNPTEIKRIEPKTTICYQVL